MKRPSRLPRTSTVTVRDGNRVVSRVSGSSSTKASMERNAAATANQHTPAGTRTTVTTETFGGSKPTSTRKKAHTSTGPGKKR